MAVVDEPRRATTAGFGLPPLAWRASAADDIARQDAGSATMRFRSVLGRRSTGSGGGASRPRPMFDPTAVDFRMHLMRI
jgi:hypothetical protein